jgi:outer membrane lipopolysaccharide assembly protein LptE/RlpB
MSTALGRSITMLALLALVAATGGCGFQLRTWDLASSIDSAYLTANPRNSLEAPLRRALRQAGIDEARALHRPRW